MKQRRLGNTGIDVSELAFGGVEIGMPYGLHAQAGAAGLMDASSAIALLHQALDRGINFYDTARLYGNSEAFMGKAFAGKRSAVVFATKCRHFKDPAGQIPAYGPLRKLVESSLQESLRALQTDYIDVFMVHYADLAILENEDVQRVFTALRSAGTVRAIGVSVYEPSETQQALEAGCWDLIQLPFNLMDQRQRVFFDEAARRGIGIVARSVLLRGLLSDRNVDWHPALKKVEQHIASYQALVRPPIRHLAQLATKFVLSYPAVTSVLVGLDKEEYLEEAISTALGDHLDEHLFQKAIAMAYPDPDFLNLANWDRRGWI
ncbi:aldo/keto reductase [Olivibacter sp. SDN3]|uniref:aldo/keto reductase n=1 Tax=Olivibacter sp. SDN3 TaxID=2764720 RepID=UPI001650F262|nr:aldo/keto reductase [Olivibacter sp. SDN3]QNL51559.1 aldo/keto reductase [Olivibacter sp. SDN3]